MTSESLFDTGAYGSCGISSRAPNGENHDNLYAEYFVNHPDLKW